MDIFSGQLRTEANFNHLGVAGYFVDARFIYAGGQWLFSILSSRSRAGVVDDIWQFHPCRNHP